MPKEHIDVAKEWPKKVMMKEDSEMMEFRRPRPLRRST